MKSLQTEAIVLRTAVHNEADRLVTYLTPAFGKLVGIARNAGASRKRFGHCLEPCSLVELTFRQGKGLAWLEQSRLVDAHLALREDPLRWSYAGLATEVLTALVPEGSAQEDLFALTRGALEQLTRDPEPLNVFVLFLIRLVRDMGQLPDFQSCRTCRAAPAGGGEWTWQVHTGSLFCPAHPPNGSSGLLLDSGTLMLIRQAADTPIAKLWRLRVRKNRLGDLRRALLEWVMAQTQKPLKALKVLRQFEERSANAREFTGA